MHLLCDVAESISSSPCAVAPEREPHGAVGALRRYYLPMQLLMLQVCMGGIWGRWLTIHVVMDMARHVAHGLSMFLQ